MNGVRQITSTGEEVPIEGEVLASLLDLLNEVELASFATVSPTSEAHIFNAYFCFSAIERLRIWILTSPMSKHAEFLVSNPSISMAVASSGQPWPQPKRGVQLFGRGRQVPDPDVGTPIAFYGERYSGFPQILTDPNSLAGLESRFFELTFDRAKVFDEARFGPEVWIDVVF